MKCRGTVVYCTLSLNVDINEGKSIDFYIDMRYNSSSCILMKRNIASENEKEV